MTLDFTPDALFFDMDGLLLDTERAGSLAFLQITRPFGLAEDHAEAFYASLVGSSGAVTRGKVAELIPGLDMDAFFMDWHAALDLQMEREVPVKPTVRETLHALTGQGRRLAVVTSTHGARARQHLERAGLHGHFETIVGGDEVDANKPDPAPYLTAAARLGVNPARSLAFEDSDYGVASATAAGCVVVQVPDIRPAGKPFPALGQRIAADLSAAMSALGLVL